MIKARPEELPVPEGLAAALQKEDWSDLEQLIARHTPVLQAYAKRQKVQWRHLDNPHAHAEDCCWTTYDGFFPEIRTHIFDPEYQWRLQPVERDFWLCPVCHEGFREGEPVKSHIACNHNLTVDPIHVREVMGK